MNTIIKISFPIFFVMLVSSCGTNKHTDTPTSGSITIYVDETLQPIIESEIKVFEASYQDTRIHAVYTSEVEALEALKKDSCRLILITRKLISNEKDAFEQRGFYTRDVLFAKDGIAMITHKDNPDTMITIQTLRDILCGKITRWKQIDPASKLHNIRVIFDNPHSSNARFLIDSVCKTCELSDNIAAMDKNTEVISYVAHEPNALGIVGVNWLIKKDDTTSSFMQKINVMRLTRSSEATFENTCQPYRYYLFTKEYPLIRNLYAITDEPRSGLSDGFLAFLCSQRGQMIIYKGGLLPATQPIRVVELSNSQNY